MQNLFICKFSALKIQFFRPYPFSLPPALHFPPIRLPPRPRSSSAPVSLILVELGLSCAHGTGKAWLTKRDVHGIPYGEARGRRTECAVQAVRFGNVASPVQSSFLGIVPVGVYCQICILKKYCHADSGRRTLWGESAPDGCRTLVGTREHQTVAEPLLERERRLWAQDTLGRESTRRSQNPCWGASADCGRRTF